MAKKCLVSKNTIDRQSMVNVLRKLVFSNTDINVYNPTRVYNTGDKAFVIDDTTGRIAVIIATSDSLTGPIDYNYWRTVGLADIVFDESYKLSSVSSSTPTYKGNLIWVSPVSYDTYDLPDPIEPETESRITLVFAGSIPVVEDETDPDVVTLAEGIFLDTEGNIIVDDPDADFEDTPQILIDEQQDVEVSDTIPSASDPALVWIDTDLTDDISTS